MPIVNYVREHIRFIEYASDEHLSASERLLWYALMHVMNQRAQGNVWPEEFIRISNERLLTLCPMKYDTLAAARNSLKQRGLIEYTRGEKNRLSPAYRMTYFYPQYLPSETARDGELTQAADIKRGAIKRTDERSGDGTSQNYTACYPKNSDNMGDNMGGNIGDNMGGNMGYIYINNTENDNNPNYHEDDEERRARMLIEKAWNMSIGGKPTPAASRDLIWRIRQFEMQPEVAALAVEESAKRGAANPWAYTVTLLYDWSAANVKTAEDAERYINDDSRKRRN